MTGEINLENTVVCCLTQFQLHLSIELVLKVFSLAYDVFMSCGTEGGLGKGSCLYNLSAFTTNSR